jgi:hypothetical protein
MVTRTFKLQAEMGGMGKPVGEFGAIRHEEGVVEKASCIAGSGSSISARRQGEKDPVTGAKFDTARTLFEALQPERLTVEAGHGIEIAHDEMGASDMHGTAEGEGFGFIVQGGHWMFSCLWRRFPLIWRRNVVHKRTHFLERSFDID